MLLAIQRPEMLVVNLVHTIHGQQSFADFPT
jgi:hypothetical protein